MRARYVLQSDKNVNAWMAEAADDRIDVLDGIVGLADPGDNTVGVLEQEKRRILDLKSKHGIIAPRKGEVNMAKLAGLFGVSTRIQIAL